MHFVLVLESRASIFLLDKRLYVDIGVCPKVTVVVHLLLGSSSHDIFRYQASLL